MRPIAFVFCAVIVGLLLLLVTEAGRIDPPNRAPVALPGKQRIDDSVGRVNGWFRERWAAESIAPAESADDLIILRRLSLALHGTIPSLEEIRSFTADSSTDRIQRWLLRMLDDNRFTDYFADRLARLLTGVEDGPFVVFRRDRLRDWLAIQLQIDRPWTEVATDLISSRGLWTDEPSSNFITVANVDQEGLDENKLAGRTVRAFLGQRIDCAQCHDHPFDSWKQEDFEGLAAFYGQTRLTTGGVVDRKFEDDKPVEYRIIDPGEEAQPEGDQGRIVQPRVPFHDDWLPQTGSRREQLAAWITHPENRRFNRAIANRIWGLMFGRSWRSPVDDLPHPSEGADADLLDLLGDEFRNHDYSLKFLIRLIAESDVFRLNSEAPFVDADTYTDMEREWAVFPLVRLRPEQVIGSMFQAGNVRAIDQNSHLFVRFQKFNNENDFMKQYGDSSEDELLQQTGTIPQALLRMNGKFTRELTQAEPFSAAGQIMNFSENDELVVENCFLACLSRRPNREERAFFLKQLRQGDGSPKTRTSPADEVVANSDESKIDGQPADDEEPGAVPQKRFPRKQVVRDLFWVLFNSPEFSWNH